MNYFREPDVCMLPVKVELLWGQVEVGAHSLRVPPATPETTEWPLMERPLGMQTAG